MPRTTSLPDVVDDRTVVTFYVDRSVRERLRAVAVKQDRSMSSLVRKALEDLLAEAEAL
jgi:predicted transcriptional regulator